MGRREVGRQGGKEEVWLGRRGKRNEVGRGIEGGRKDSRREVCLD